MEALFSGDEQEAAKSEEAALNLGYGPLANCSTVSNCSQQKAYCREFNQLLLIPHPGLIRVPEFSIPAPR
jgi:hypothetical protein